MKQLTPLYDPANGPMRIIALMSGSGTNVQRTLEHQENLKKTEGSSPFEVIGIFSDTLKSQAAQIAAEYDLTVIIRDIRSFYKVRDLNRMDLSQRHLFDEECIKIIKPFNPDLALYGGYMSITTPLMTKAFLSINVHPGDLRVIKEGKRRWVGMHPVRDCLLAGEESVRACTHIVEPEVDGGPLLLLSEALSLEIPEDKDINNKEELKQVEALNQEKLKKMGDWKIMPLTVEYLARGFYSSDENGTLYFKEKPIPQGLLLEDVEKY